MPSGEVLTAPVVVLAAGAIQTAALLLASANARHPNGLANRSDQVGRNFMNHNTSAVLALHPLRKNDVGLSEDADGERLLPDRRADGAPLGNIQLLGKISGTILARNDHAAAACWPTGSPAHSVDLYAMSEDLPNPESRVTLKDGQIVLDWKRSNWEAHLALVARLKATLRQAGYPIVLSRPFDRRTPSHQCGTARMGT